MAAGYILAVFFTVLGGGCVWLALQPVRHNGWFDRVFLMTLAIAFIAMAMGMAYCGRHLCSRHVELCTEGFRYSEGSGWAQVRWEHVQAVHETVVHERLPVVGRVKGKSEYSIEADDQWYHFNVNHVEDIKAFGSLLREAAERWQIPWTLAERFE